MNMPTPVDSTPETAIGTELTQHAKWLRRLAADLVGAAGADDLVQQTYVAALAKPPSADRPLRPWLAAVLRNTWRMGRRTTVRRQRREANTASAPAEGPVDAEALVARAQRLREVGELLESLDEPYRRTLLLRYLEDVPVATIAEREAVKAGTVRWRIKTGLDMLRDELDARHGGDRQAWVGALVPLAASRAGSGAAATAGAATVKLSTKSIIILSTLAVVAGAATTLAARGDDEDAAAPEVSAEASAPQPRAPAAASRGAAPVPNATDESGAPSRKVRRFASAAQRRAALARLAALRPAADESADAGDDDPPAPTADDQRFTDAVSDMIGAPEVAAEFLLPALDECLEGLPQRGKGHLTMHMSVAGAPDVGTLIEIAEVDAKLSSALPDEVVECAIQTGYALDFPPPPVPGSARIDVSIGLRYAHGRAVCEHRHRDPGHCASQPVRRAGRQRRAPASRAVRRRAGGVSG